MTSNALSKRRGLLRRPKVCHSSDKALAYKACPPPPPPPPCAECSIDPETGESQPWVSTAFEILGCCDDLEFGDPIGISYVMTGGFVDHYVDPTNCDEPGLFDWTPTETGVFTVTAIFTFSDASECRATATITVIP